MDYSLMLKELREYYKLHKNSEFAAFLGLTDQNAYSWVKRGYADLELVYQKCPELNPEWILSGGTKGPMLRSTIEQQVKGDNNTVTGGNNVGPSTETLNKTLDALASSQNQCSKFQSQIDSLLEIVKHSVTKNNE